MSTRQLKRLEKLAAARHNDDDSDSGSSSDDMPATMMKPKNSKKNKKKQMIFAAHESDSESDEQQSAVLPTRNTFSVTKATTKPSAPRATKASSPSAAAEKQAAANDAPKAAAAPKKKPSTSYGNKNKKVHVDPAQDPAQEDDGDDSWVVKDDETEEAAATTKKTNKKSKKEQREAKKQKEAEEDALLDALLGGDDADGSNDNDDAAGSGSSSPKNLPSVSSLMCCSATKLDVRIERIKAFGANSVEDVGDRSGGNRNSNSREYRSRGHKAQTFRTSPFATPNRYEWAPFYGLGVTLTKAPAALTDSLNLKNANKRDGPAIYMLDATHADHRAAQAEFERVVSSMGGPEQIFAIIRRYPYHIPTLLQANTLFVLMGDVPQSQLMLDMALYALGIAMSRFPFEMPSSKRLMPHSIKSNQIVFVALQRAIHTAMKKGCAKTALNLAKLLLSLDDQDPKFVLLILDYIALRAAEWKWLVDLFDSLMAENSPLLALPSLHFHAALAKFLSEQNDAEKKNNKKPTKGAESSEPVVEVPTMSATERMKNAIRVFPAAAVQLAEKVGEKAGDKPWSDMLPLLMGHTEEERGALGKDLEHVTELFVEHSHDLWKPRDVLNWLKSCATSVTKDQEAERHLFAVRRQGWLRTGILEQYRQARKDDMSGEQHQQIAPELLNADMPQMGGGLDFDEQDFLVTERERDMLLRFEALFGRLEPSEYPTPRHQLERYSEMIAEHERELGENTNPVTMFFQTMMPWNDVTEMTMRRLFEQRGIVDPVRAREQAERQRDDVDAAAVLDSSDEDVD